MKTLKMKWTVLFSLVLFAVMSAGEACGGATYYVYNSEGLYNAQHGIGYPALQDGDTIVLAPGIYQQGSEAWHAPVDPDGKNVIFRSMNATDPNYIPGYDYVENTILYGGRISVHDSGSYFYLEPAAYFHNGEDSGCQLTGLTIITGYLSSVGIPIDGRDQPWPCGELSSTCGAIACDGASPTISECKIEGGDTYIENWVWDSPGIYCRDSNALIQNCTVSIAHEDAGDAAIEIDEGNGDVTIAECTFSGNSKPCVYSLGACDVTITDCNIDGGNIAQGLSLNNWGKTTITGSTIKDCYASTDGGGGVCIIPYTGYTVQSVEINDCNFIGNNANSLYGGAINIERCYSAIISNCTILDNEAEEGGGIYIGSGVESTTIDRCLISNNKARKDNGWGRGGGICYWDEAETTPTYCKITHCTLVENQAVNSDSNTGCYGGGICCRGGVGDSVDIENCLITENTADGRGGGIHVEFVSGGIKVLNCTVAGNSVTGPGSCGSGISFYANQNIAPVELTNCIFWGNTPAQQIKQTSPGGYDYATISHCDIEHSKRVEYNGNYYIADDAYADEYEDFYFFGKDLGYNLPTPEEDGDPDFTADYHLNSGSPCINAGDNSVVTWLCDIDGQLRIMDYLVDIGADEYGEEEPQGRVHNITQDKWYNYIQDAIGDANSGDEIVAYPSIYYENISFAALNIRSSDPNNQNTVAATIINGGSGYATVDIGHDAILNGFTVTGGTWTCINCYCSGPTIKNCIIEDNIRYGIYHSSPSYVPSVIIQNNIIRRNGSGSNYGSGIWTDSGSSIIEGNKIYGNRRGIYAYADSTPIIRNNEIYEHVYGGSEGIYIDRGTAIIEENHIYGNGYGVLSLPYSTSMLERNWIYNNGKGIYLIDDSTATIRNNLIYSNGYGIDTVFSSVSISNNTIVKNTERGISDWTGYATIYNCILWDNGDDLDCEATYSCISNCEQAGGVGNICGDGNNPCFVNIDANNYHLTENSPCVNTGNPDGNYAGQTDIDGDTRVIGPRVDMGADEYGKVHNINKDRWYDHIQDAIGDANSGDEIVAYPGTYYENINFVALNIRSIDPNDPCTVTATVINGGSGYAAVDIGHDAILNGFTVTGGTWTCINCYCSGPTIKNCIIEDNIRYGIYHSSPSYVPSVIIQNNIIRRNGSGSNYGSGIWTDSGSSIIEGNKIYGNRRGIYAYADSTPIIRNNEIYEHVYGGSEGIYIDRGTAIIEENHIYGNGYGVLGLPYSTSTLKRNWIYNNGEGIYLIDDSTATIRNNLIYSNGYGIDAVFSPVSISNNTIVKNLYAGIICFSASEPIYNCIIWDNGDDFYDGVTYSCISNCDYAGDPAVTHNICGDGNNPCFVSIDANNYHLSANSPCINAGDPNKIYAGQTDIDGEPRVLMGRVDMGADETYYSAPDSGGEQLSQSGDPNEPNEPNDPDAHWWKLDETSGTTAYDSVGNNDGTFNGNDPCWVDGFIGGAVDLNGVNDYFSISSLDTAYNNNSIFTVAGWFKTDQSTGKQTIVGQWSQVWDAGQEYFGWQVLVENNKVIARFGHDIDTYDITGTQDVNDGGWHHFAMVRNGTNVAVYVDGQPEGTGTANFYTYNTKFRIGDGSYTYGYPPPLKGGPFNGMIDDVMIFHKVLPAEEVEELYLNGL